MAEQAVELLFLSPSSYMFYVTGIRHPHFGVIKVPGDWLSGAFISLDRDPIFVGHWMLVKILVRQAILPSEAVPETRVLEQGDDPLVLLESVLAEFKLRQERIAVADRTPARFMEALKVAAPHAEISMASKLMDIMLAVKDEDELCLMRKIAKITDAAYEEVLSHLRLGITEEEVAREVDYQLRKLGAEGNAFRTEVVFTRPEVDFLMPGEHLQPGDSITFDFGGVYEGYTSDFGRSVFAGDPPPEYLTVHEIVLRAEAEATKAMRGGQITCEEVDAIARKVIADEGYGPNFTFRLGHGIGIRVHNVPLLIPGDKTLLRSGMTFAVEPSIHIPGRFSNRVEDVVLVTDEGAVYLTTYSRELHIVD